jgi:hypothetical protein
MKKIFFNRVAVMMAITLISFNGYAQKQSSDPAFNNNMKIEPNSSAGNVTSAPSYSTNVAELNSKIGKNFSKNFKNPEDVRINKFKDFTYIYCVTNGVTNRIRYDRKGNWDYTIRYYQENLLPKEIRKQVRSTYYDFNIEGVTEVSVGDKTAYLVRIKSADLWKTVKIVDDEMIETESYQVR